MWDRLKNWARSCKREVRALGLALRHPGTPWYAKAWLGLVVAYAFSPIDLVPDFVPVLGYLDDLILLPVGIWIALRLIPEDVLAQCRQQADQDIQNGHSIGWVGLAMVILVWVAASALTLWLVSPWLR